MKIVLDVKINNYYHQQKIINKIWEIQEDNLEKLQEQVVYVKQWKE